MNRNRAKLRVLLIGVLFLPLIGWWEGRIRIASASEASFVLTFHDNLLSAKIETVPLTKVLARLAQLTLIESSLDGSIENETVSVEFNNLPLEEGIRRILQGKNYALTYAQTSFSRGHTALPKVVGIRVVPKGAGPNTEKRDADSVPPLSGPDMGEGLPKPFEAQTMEASTAPDSATVTALRDQDPKVREAALERLGQAGQQVPVESLAEMAGTDANPDLRMNALELLAEKGGDAAVDPLKQALRDPDPGVRGLAQGLVEERRVLAQTLLEELKEESH